MKLYVDIDGSVKIELDRLEVKNAGVAATVAKWITPEMGEAILSTSDEKALEYLNAIGDTSGKPIRDLIMPSPVIEFKEKEYMDDDEDFRDHQHDNGCWTCGVCGSPNTVSHDEGCTNCDH